MKCYSNDYNLGQYFMGFDLKIPVGSALLMVPLIMLWVEGDLSDIDRNGRGWWFSAATVITFEYPENVHVLELQSVVHQCFLDFFPDGGLLMEASLGLAM